MRYMLLAPAESFRDIAEEAKSVILAGGTMSPVSLSPVRSSVQYLLTARCCR